MPDGDDNPDFPVIPDASNADKDRAWRYAVHYGLKRIKEDLHEQKLRLEETRKFLFALERKILRWAIGAALVGGGGGLGAKKLLELWFGG